MIVSCSVQYSLFTWAYWHVVVQEQPLLLLSEHSQGLWCRGISKPGPSAVGCWVVFFVFICSKKGRACSQVGHVVNVPKQGVETARDCCPHGYCTVATDT